MNRRRTLHCLLAATSAAALASVAGCSGLFGPQVITLGEADLAELLGRSFPQTRRVAEVLDVELSAPQLRLLPESNRLSVALAVRTRERIRGSAARGQLSFDCALRYEPQDASLRLTQVRGLQVSMDAERGTEARPPAAPRAAPKLEGRPLGDALVERLLEDLPIYRISADRLAGLRQRGLQPGAVTVTARGVEVTLARIGP